MNRPYSKCKRFIFFSWIYSFRIKIQPFKYISENTYRSICSHNWHIFRSCILLEQKFTRVSPLFSRWTNSYTPCAIYLISFPRVTIGKRFFTKLCHSAICKRHNSLRIHLSLSQGWVWSLGVVFVSVKVTSLTAPKGPLTRKSKGW